MSRILIDTNVIMDVLFARDPFLSDSITVLHMCEDGLAEAVVTTKTIADVYYFLRKHLGSEAKARKVIRKLTRIVSICDVTARELEAALDVKNDDFEDALQAECAKAANCKLIITRNKDHFLGTGIKCLTPQEFVF